MRNISRKITAIAITGALALPATVSTAHAQLSFGSSDFGSSATSSSKADRLERGIEELQELLGDIRDPELEAKAEALLQRVINGEISMPDGYYRSADKNIYSTATRLTEEEVDEYLQDLPEMLEAAKKGTSEFHIYFGAAVGEADGSIYAVFIEEVPTGWGPR